jgi:hypothetical protein
VPRCSRCSFYGKLWRQSFASSQCGISSPSCEMMAKTVVSAVKPDGQAMRPACRAFLLVQQPSLASVAGLGELVCSPVAHIYRDNGTVLYGVLRCAWKSSPSIDLPASADLAGLRQIISWNVRPRPWRGLLLEPGKNSACTAGAHCLSPPQSACQSILYGPRHPLDPCFLFFLAAKCPTHLK